VCWTSPIKLDPQQLFLSWRTGASPLHCMLPDLEAEDTRNKCNHRIGLGVKQYATWNKTLRKQCLRAAIRHVCIWAWSGRPLWQMSSPSIYAYWSQWFAFCGTRAPKYLSLALPHNATIPDIVVINSGRIWTGCTKYCAWESVQRFSLNTPKEIDHFKDLNIDRSIKWELTIRK
jgi:hypothetical protein